MSPQPPTFAALAVAAATAVLLGGCGGATAPVVGAPSTTSDASASSAPTPSGLRTPPSAGTSTASASSTASPAPATPVATETNPPGDIPDTQAYVELSILGGVASVKVPEGWARTDSTPSAAKSSRTVFADKLNSIAVQATTGASTPTVSSVTASDVPRLATTTAKLSDPKVTATTRAAGPVVLLTFLADSAQDPVTGKVVRDSVLRYTFYRNGTRVDLTLSGPVLADNVDPWNTVSNSLRWLR